MINYIIGFEAKARTHNMVSLAISISWKAYTTILKYLPVK